MSGHILTVVPRTQPTFEKAKDVQKIMRKNHPVLRRVIIYTSPKPLHSLIAVAMENFVNSQDKGLFASLIGRFNYVETGLISLACALYHFVMALGVTLAAGAALGQSDVLNNAFNKHWLHAAIAACGIGASVLGFISPLVGAIVTGGLLSVIVSRVRSTWNELKLPSKKQRVEIIKALYEQHREDLYQGLELAVDSDKVNKMIERFDRAIKKARSIEQLLMECLKGIVHLPQAQN